MVFQQEVISTYVSMISQHEAYALKESNYLWEVSSLSIRAKDPYCFENFKYALSRVPRYIKCMETCGSSWLGLNFIFPLIWFPERQYKRIYKLTKKAERYFWANLIASNGFLHTRERPESSFNFTNFHKRCLESYSYSNQLEVVAWGHAIGQLGGDVGCQKCPFLPNLIYPFSMIFPLTYMASHYLPKQQA